MLEPYVPSRDGPFGREEAAHLFRRAAFGATPAELETAVRLGLDATLDRLFGAEEGTTAAGLAASAAVVAERDELPPLQALWLARMVASAAPAVEKLALFWHGHFATSFEKVRRGRWMWEQYELFRSAGGGPFRDLLLAVARDPAMLVWLDSNSNERGRPNENFARELFELFSLGLGSYTERDVQEAARAFSGWHLKDGRFAFNARAHDAKEKTIFGRTGPLDGGDVVDLCVARPECPRFLAARLLRYYVEPEPPLERVAALAAILVEEGLRIAPALRRLFGSRDFFAPTVRRTLIAGPVEWCVGLLRRTQARASWQAVAQAAAAMGQALFAPPSVKGWDGQRAWISSQTLLERLRFVEALAFGGGEIGATLDWERLAAEGGSKGAELVRRIADRLLDGALQQETATRIARFADEPAAGSGRGRIERVAQLVLAAPEALLT